MCLMLSHDFSQFQGHMIKLEMFSIKKVKFSFFHENHDLVENLKTLSSMAKNSKY